MDRKLFTSRLLKQIRTTGGQIDQLMMDTHDTMKTIPCCLLSLFLNTGQGNQSDFAFLGF